MPFQTSYTLENPPTKGTARKIWKVLTDAGFGPEELHYNGGRRGADGGGTWACETQAHGETWCGLHGRTMVYIQSNRAPYMNIIAGFTSRACPYYRRTRYYTRITEELPGGGTVTMNGPTETYMACKQYKDTGIFGVKCKAKNCDDCTDEFLTERNNEYAKHKR